MIASQVELAVQIAPDILVKRSCRDAVIRFSRLPFELRYFLLENHEGLWIEKILLTRDKEGRLVRIFMRKR